MKATISADIISSTSLSSKELVLLRETINGAFVVIEEHLSKEQQSFFGANSEVRYHRVCI